MNTKQRLDVANLAHVHQCKEAGLRVWPKLEDTPKNHQRKLLKFADEVLAIQPTEEEIREDERDMFRQTF